MELMDGKKVAHFIKDELKNKVARFKLQNKSTPCLCVILIGNNPASQIYVQKKIKACENVGMLSKFIHLPSDVSMEKVEKILKDLNNDSKVHGILVQLPIPNSLDPEQITSWISPKKDVDGLTIDSIGWLWSSQSKVKPCTPYGIIKLLEHYKIPIEGQHAVVVGRSSIVGKPMVNLLLEKQATVTICHSKTKNLAEHTQRGDIVIAACGKHHLLKAEHFKKGAVVIDVGIHRVQKNGKSTIEGDVCPDQLETKVAYLSPVPGGVGPMTIAMLLENTYQLALNQIL